MNGALRQIDPPRVPLRPLDRPEGPLESRPPAHASGPESKAKACEFSVAILTGGADKPYSLGLAAALLEQNIPFDFIGSNEIDGPELHNDRRVNFLNLRGDQSRNASSLQKAARVLAYYLRLARYALSARPRIFHILWNNKFEHFDRTILTLYYRMLRKKIVFTAHNVNAGKRDGNDSWFNRFTLGVQYRLAHHIFVHTENMKRELMADFGVPAEKIGVIPFGINNTTPVSGLTPSEARGRLNLPARARTMLFFGNIAPYKGLQYLIEALARLAGTGDDWRLLIAGKPKNCAAYWQEIQSLIAQKGVRHLILENTEFIPDPEVEIYFKAADVLVLPYTHIFQSGVLFLGYSFGLPVIASDVGSMREDIVPDQTGMLVRPEDSANLAAAIESYFSGGLFRNLDANRDAIRRFANEKYSWTKVGQITRRLYDSLSGN